MLSLPQKAMAGLASALVMGALAPSAANASLFRFSVSGQFDDFNDQTDDFTFGLRGGSFSGEIVADSLPASDSSRLISWEIDLFDRFGFPRDIFTSVLFDAGGQNDPSFSFSSVGSFPNVDSFLIGKSIRGRSERQLQLPFANGFEGSGPILVGGSSLLVNSDNGRFIDGVFIPPTGILGIISGSATLISGPTFGEIDFTFDATPVATLDNSPDLVELDAGLSVEGLSYSLKALDLDLPLQEFSWNATRDISVSWTEPSLASIFGSTTISLEGAASEIEFFVEGLLNNAPFDRYTTKFNLADSASQFVEWDLAQITDLMPGDYTLALTSGVRWQPGDSNSVLTVSSQYGADVAPIPTPALLPGLIGMGAAALRRSRKDESA